ncbi:MAG TPA: YdcF family protein [Bacteroidia bacterium]|nr:YdcF family protein [Bacteroidia bacterium]
MFFFLSKILAFLLMPLTWFFVLLIWSWRAKDPGKKKRLRIAAIVVIVLFSNRFVFDRTMHIWEIDAVKEPAPGTYDAIIVLGGMSTYDQQLDRIQFSRGTDRLLQAIELWKKGVAKKIIFTGGSGSILHSDILESDQIKSYLHKAGIPDSVMIYENKSRNTHENATMTKPILQKYFPNGKFLLITSAFHMRRSLGCFAKEGIPVTPYSVDRYSGPWKFEFDYMFLPSPETLGDWNILFHEWVGCISYKLSGYI